MKEERKKQDKNIMSASATQGSHNYVVCKQFKIKGVQRHRSMSFDGNLQPVIKIVILIFRSVCLTWLNSHWLTVHNGNELTHREHYLSLRAKP